MLGRARRPLLVAAAAAGALLAVALAGGAFTVTTTTGARLALAAVKRLLPGELTVDTVAGSIAGGLTLTNLRYRSPEVAARVARVAIVPRLRPLLEGRVVLAQLGAEDGTVELHETEPAATPPAGEPPQLPEIPEWLAVEVLAIREVALAGTVDAAVAQLDASVAGPRLEFRTLHARAAGGRIEASGTVGLTEQAADIEATWIVPAGEGADGGETRIELAARLELVTRTRPWRATLAWERLSVQAAGTQWSSPTGNLTLTPGTTPIEAELTAELVGEELPTSAALSGSARLTGTTLELEELAIDALGGHIVVHGVADLAALAGHAALEYSMLDPALLDPRIEGRLHGNVVAAFAVEPDLVAAVDGAVGGTVGGRPLDGALRVHLNGNAAHIERAHVELERSVIDVGGGVSGDAVDLRFVATLPALADWYPPAAGSVRARGSLAGPAINPTIEVRLDAADIALESLPPLAELSLEVNGTLSAHEASLTASSPYGEVELRVEQSWSDGQLAGSLLQSRLVVDRGGDWTLTAPAGYAVAGASVQVEETCHSGPEDAQLCVAVADDTLRVDATGLPSALAEPWLGGGLRLTGAAELALTLGWRPALHGTFTLTQPLLRLQAAAGDREPPAAGALASIDDLRVTGTLTQQALDAKLTAALTATRDPLEARVTLTPPTADGTLDATLAARLTSLELVDAVLEDVDELAGSVTADFRATGTPANPILEGEIAARALAGVLPRLGIDVTDGSVTARSTGLDGLTFTAQLCSAGCVELDGALALATDTRPWQATAALRGSAFKLADLPNLRAVVAPDLTLDATATEWRVTGEVAIEEGLAAVDAVPRSAVRPVPETVVHGREVAPDSELSVPLVVDVDVGLGDVRFEGLGVSAELDGLLAIELDREGRLLVNGTASIEDGTFSAYSQQLQIERGDLLFTGPADNPALDVRATREVEGATVGLTVTGTLREPESEVFSMPALTESEALARLVTGRSLASADTADAQAIERAALGLGIRRALPALERIGDNLGLDELGVATGSGEPSALVAGRQLGEDVYLRYKHGLFDDFAGLELIYRITERFRLRTETGTSQSIDVLYERNRQEDTPLAETESAFENAAEPRGPAAPE